MLTRQEASDDGRVKLRARSRQNNVATFLVGKRPLIGADRA